MPNPLRHLLLPAIFITVFASCDKNKGIPDTTAYSFTNSFSDQLTLNFYTSRDDYNNNTAPAHYTIEPGATISVTFDVRKKYWVDWYTAGYTYNNWMDSARTANTSGIYMPTPRPYLPVALAEVHYGVYAGDKDTARSILLNGNGTGSTWKVVVTNNAALNGTHIFRLRKDFSCEYTYTDMSGNSTTSDIVYFVNSDYPNLSIDFYDNRFNTNEIIEFALDPPFYAYHARDTLNGRFWGYNYNYPAIRQ